MQYFFSKKSFLIVTTFLLYSLGVFADDDSQKSTNVPSLDKRINHARKYLLEKQSDDATRIPDAILNEAKAIIFIEQFKAGFILGIKGGKGIAMARNKKGKWSAPAFYEVVGGSAGLQIGGELRNMILVIMDEQALSMLEDKFEIGVDIAAAAGPIGNGADLNFNRAPILVYSSSKGLFAGAAFQGGMLGPDNASNRLFYNNPKITAHDILFEDKVDMPDVAKPLVELLTPKKPSLIDSLLGKD